MNIRIKGKQCILEYNIHFLTNNMFKEWFFPEPKKIGFEDVKYALVSHSRATLIINTLDAGEQNCLIKTSIHANDEERIINQYIEDGIAKTHRVIVYGRHGCDPKVASKCKQLQSLGFGEVYMYVGGLFEWLLLQDIYGDSEFPTTSKAIDILKYRPPKTW
jgi:rhodanese-related sulfurtransferase